MPLAKSHEKSMKIAGRIETYSTEKLVSLKLKEHAYCLSLTGGRSRETILHGIDFGRTFNVTPNQQVNEYNKSRKNKPSLYSPLGVAYLIVHSLLTL